MQKPNILLILTDQQRVDTLGFQGQTPCRTPNIDRIANEGTSFDRAITPSPLCLPARTALFTGLYPHQTATLHNSDTLRHRPTLLTNTKEAGYHIAYAGTWHMGEQTITQWTDCHAAESTREYSAWCKSHGLPDGWAFNDIKTRSHRAPHMSTPVVSVSPVKANQTNDAWITRHALNLLRARPTDRPFFLTCSFNGPHPPFQVPQPYFDMYDPADAIEPVNFRPTAGEPKSNATSYYRTLWRDHGDNWKSWQKSVAVYWGFVTMIDGFIGQVLNALREEGVDEQTVIVFASDHGEMLGQHGLWHKNHAYEPSLRIPLILRGTGLAQGQRSSASCSLIDIAPTLLNLVGADVPTNLEGRDLRTLDQPSTPRDNKADRRLVFSELKSHGDWHGIVDWRMVCDGQYKYTWNNSDRDQLYDLLADPHELSNRVNDQSLAEPLKRLRGALGAWMRRTGDPLAHQMQTQCPT